ILGVMAALAPAMGLFVPLNRPAGVCRGDDWAAAVRMLERRTSAGFGATKAHRGAADSSPAETGSPRPIRRDANKVAISSKRLFSVISFALLPHTGRRNLRHRWRPLGGPKPLLPTPAAPFPVVPSGGALRRSVVRLYGKGDRVWMTTADPALLSPPSMFWTPTSCSMTPTLC